MLELADLTVDRGGRPVVEGVTLRVAPGDVLAVLGPSGAGKSTLLRAVAGLEPVASGTVAWEGRDVTSLAAHRRGFGMVFQDHALFPHLDVAANVGFGLRMRAGARRPSIRGGRARPDHAARVAEVLELVGLAGFGPRRPATLSGGERQRVAIARALAPAPGLLLLDEPLGALDRVLRERLGAELDDLLGRLGVAALYVTHDQEEAFALADRLAVLDAGRIVQQGAPAEVWRRPVDARVARFLGFANLVPARVDGGVVELPWGRVPAPAGSRPGPGLLVLPPDSVSLDPAAPLEGGARVGGRVRRTSYRGDHFVATVDVGGLDLEVPAPSRAVPAAGAVVTVGLDSRLAHVVARD